MSLVAEDDELDELIATAPSTARDRPIVTSAQFSAFADRVWSAPDSVVMAVGHPDTLIVRVESPTGEPIPGHLFRWDTSNSAIATVDRSGVVEPRTPGVATISAYSNAGGSQRRREDVTVRVYPQPTGVRFDPEAESVEVFRGRTLRITAAIELPSTEIVRALVPNFTLTDTTVLALRENGEVLALREGQAEITGTIAGYTRKWMVRVKPGVLRIDETSNLMRLGASRSVAASYHGEEDVRISEALGATWRSSDPSVLQVGGTSVEAVGLGRAWLIASSASGQDSVRIDVVGELLATLQTDGGDASIHTIPLGAGEAQTLPTGPVPGFNRPCHRMEPGLRSSPRRTTVARGCTSWTWTGRIPLV